MEPAGCPLVPSGSLPPLRVLDTLTEDQIFASLTNLAALYCPLTASFASTLVHKHGHAKVSDSDFVDSGYTSATEDDEGCPGSTQQRLAALRADDYERSFTERWLTRFIARATEIPSLSLEETMERAVHQAASILESFHMTPTDDEQGDQSYTRHFSFALASSSEPPVAVHLNDGLSGRDSTDPDDVGLQSWGASIVLSRQLCAEPARFGLTSAALGPCPRIVELGAGTGLISLVLGSLLPRLAVPSAAVIATDYHPAVLANLSANIAANFTSPSSPLSSSSSSFSVSFSTPRKPQVETAFLDWSRPSLVAPLDKKADMLIAADAVYAPEHATWLRDCATALLSPSGVFWLFTTVRKKGRFNGVSDTVEASFEARDRPTGADGRQLTILHAEDHGKTKGVGRGDESGYKLFRIGWA
ncbi:hypothetical protein D7B24_000260 [Verticillium nonalfalfae]|uniref:S-adenosylmethionine-dependent methyltransferase n=1 Tax=Verticillium nonalfalfae TaxID=1051616 RepID=A0A3M9YIP0_9PEZI|nr:uncharacterized protein D7B24_000260 [Verticillium nonalfalfae]RNJ60065.1 hypothetical protein D7B24_000260 [Verticillium nonalfalfae]